jgi:hypothetical protein
MLSDGKIGVTGFAAKRELGAKSIQMKIRAYKERIIRLII